MGEEWKLAAASDPDKQKGQHTGALQTPRQTKGEGSASHSGLLGM